MRREISGIFSVAMRQRRSGDSFDVNDLRIDPASGPPPGTAAPRMARILQ